MENLAGIFLLGLRFTLAILLFVFLFWAIRIIWKDLSITAQTESLKIIPQILLSVIAQNPITKTFSLEEIAIGRDPVCDLQIADPTVSSKHARIFYSYDQWWVEDLGSSNGSYLNDILVSTATVLTIGDQLRLGKMRINIEFPDQNKLTTN
jgi:pSer/pThr/pTyr-binding forkhead associated (FHA) protein